MGNFTPTPNERRFLRAIAAVNARRKPGEEMWWSADQLRTTAQFSDFQFTGKQSVTALGRSCAAKGLARTRRIGTLGHGWAEYRISSLGRGAVADSCIGGGGPWPGRPSWPEFRARCPACHATMTDLGLTGPLPDRVPAHPLPGYAAPAAS